MKTASFDCTRFAMRPDAFEICDLRGSGCALWSGANNLAARDSTGTIARCFPCMVHHTPRGCGDRQFGGELWLHGEPELCSARLAKYSCPAAVLDGSRISSMSCPRFFRSYRWGMIRFEEPAGLERSHGFRASCIEDPDEMQSALG
jgi:hypothetical protein